MKEFPPFRLDAADQSLWRDHQRVHLTPKAFAILSYLVERAGRLVTQDELLEAHWPDTFVQPEVLKSQILDIRTALGDRPKEPRFIETLPRRGYRFIAAVRDSATAPPPAAPRPAPSLVGRDRALQELRTCLERAAGGERQLVFVTGEQGLGKTTLVEAFLEDAAANVVSFARGQCLEGFGTVREPYYPVLDALGQLSRGAVRDLLATVLERQAPTWLIQLPGLLKCEHRESLQRELMGATRERMIREMCEALETLTTDRPVILLFEDLHWADHSTVDLIASIAHRRAPARLLLIGTFRPVDLVLSRHPLKQVAHSLKTHRLCREIAISPLQDFEIATYLSRQAGNPLAIQDQDTLDLAKWIEKQTEGNPLFMVTVIEHLLESRLVERTVTGWRVLTRLEQIEMSVPDTLRQMIELYIDRLSPREQLILETASVHGNLFSAAPTASVLEFDCESVEEACQSLAQQHQIVRTAAGHAGDMLSRYEFVHAAFRNVFYHRLTPARRARLHRRFGDVIESSCPGDRSAVAAELAGHFEKCGDWPRAVEYLRLTAGNAWRRFEHREAISILEHALQAAAHLPEPDRGRVEVRIMDSQTILQHALHDVDRMPITLEKLAERAASCGDSYVETRALVGFVVIRAAEDAHACRPLMDRLRSLWERVEDPGMRAFAHGQWLSLQNSMSGWKAGLAEEHAADIEHVRATGDPLLTASLRMDHAHLQAGSSQYAESNRTTRECLPALLQSGRLLRYQHGRDLLAVNHAFLGEWGTALDILNESIDTAQKNVAPQRSLMPLVFKAWIHLTAMDFEGVRDICAVALPALAAPFMLDRRYIAMRLAASAELGLGRCDEALEQLTSVRNAERERPVTYSWYWRMPLQIDVAEACLATGNIARAREEANRALELTQTAAERTWQALAWEVSARVAFQEDDPVRAEKDVQAALRLIEGFELAIAAWRVYATASMLDRSHLDRSRQVLRRLSDSLHSRPDLQKAFMSSAAVSSLLGNGAGQSAHAGPA